MSDFRTRRLDELMTAGEIYLGRGEVISKDDIATHPGPYPIYSSSAQNNGLFGEYGKFMFDEELISWSVDGGGYFFYRPRHRYSVTNVCGYMRIRPESWHPKFVYYSLVNQHRFLTFDYTSKAHPSVIKKQYRLPAIDVDRQRKIATILSTIDTAIEQTEALIEKYQHIKAGLMHDLFTRGVLPTGQLRPPREQAPELYQETAMGWIPRDWQISTLAECISTSPKNGYSPREVDAWEGLYALGLGCLTRDGFEPKQLKNAPRSALTSDALLLDGDFLISRANTPELVGLCGVYEKLSAPAIYPDLMMRLTLLDFVDKHFLEAQLLLPTTRVRLTAKAVGTSSSMAKLNATSIRQFQIFVPSLTEQKLVIDQLKVLGRSIRSNLVGLSKLRKQKLGLMQDLLTGKVSVTTPPSQGVATP